MNNFRNKSQAEFKLLPIESLKPGIYQARKEFDAEALHELATSIRNNGVVQPIVVRPLKALEEKNLYEIIAGERRWRAAQMVPLHEVPCLIRHYSDEQAAAASTVENVIRKDLNPIEEANAYHCMLEKFCYSHEELAALLGRSRTYVTNILRLLRLHSRVQNYIAQGLLTEGHGKALAALEQNIQLELSNKAVQYGWNVRKIENEVKNLQQSCPEKFIKEKHDANIESIENHLSDYLGCPVQIEWGKQKKRIILDCYDLECFQALLKKLDYKWENF